MRNFRTPSTNYKFAIRLGEFFLYRPSSSRKYFKVTSEGKVTPNVDAFAANFRGGHRQNNPVETERLPNLKYKSLQQKLSECVVCFQMHLETASGDVRGPLPFYHAFGLQIQPIRYPWSVWLFETVRSQYDVRYYKNVPKLHLRSTKFNLYLHWLELDCIILIRLIAFGRTNWLTRKNI